MNPYKVGDQVRRLKDNGNMSPTGTVGTVIEVLDGEEFWEQAVVVSGTAYRNDDRDGEYWFTETIELVEEPSEVREELVKLDELHAQFARNLMLEAGWLQASIAYEAALYLQERSE